MLLYATLCYDDVTPAQWLSQYEGLSLTSRGQHSALPHLHIPSCLFDTETKSLGRSNGDMTGKGSEDVLLNGDNNSSHYGNIHKMPSPPPPSSPSMKREHARAQKQLSAESYVRYLKMYARRYGLERHMQLGCSVVKAFQSDVCKGEGGGEGDVESQYANSEGSHDKAFTSCTADDSNDRGNARNQSRNMPSSSSLLPSSTLKRGSERGSGWEVHYTYLTPSGVRGIAVTHCKCVVVACGKAQLPTTDPHLMNILKGYTGYIVNAKDVKDLEGMICWYRFLKYVCGSQTVHLYLYHSSVLFYFILFYFNSFFVLG